MVVHASVPVDADPGAAGGVTVVDLPAVECAATTVHRGSMGTVLATIQTLARWIDAQGYRSTGYNRELYLYYTELQEPIAAGTGARTCPTTCSAPPPRPPPTCAVASSPPGS